MRIFLLALLLLPASTVEGSATRQYAQLMRQAQQKNALNQDPVLPLYRKKAP